MRGTESLSGQSKFCLEPWGFIDIQDGRQNGYPKMATKIWTDHIFAYKWQIIILSSATEDLPECSDEKLTWLRNIKR